MVRPHLLSCKTMRRHDLLVTSGPRPITLDPAVRGETKKKKAKRISREQRTVVASHNIDGKHRCFVLVLVVSRVVHDTSASAKVPTSFGDKRAFAFERNSV